MQWLALKLSGICVIVFILQIAIPAITENFALVSATVLSEPWTVFTHMFLHGGVTHLLYNLFALALFGTILERLLGWRRFLVIYFISGVAASIGAVIFYPATIGASGAIFGVLGCLAVLRPKMTVFMVGFPMPMVVAAAFWALGDLIGMFAPSGTANAAHLFGMAFGIVVGIYLWKEHGEFFGKKEETKISEKEFEEWESSWM